MKNIQKKKSLFQRLIACTAGDGGGSVAVAVVIAGLGITIAAAAGSKTNTGVNKAANTIADRTNTGASGNFPSPQ